MVSRIPDMYFKESFQDGNGKRTMVQNSWGLVPKVLGNEYVIDRPFA